MLIESIVGSLFGGPQPKTPNEKMLHRIMMVIVINFLIVLVIFSVRSPADESARTFCEKKPRACRIYSASYPAALKKFRHSVTEKRLMMSPRALAIVSKLRAARFLRSALSFENAISMGFRSGE